VKRGIIERLLSIIRSRVLEDFARDAGENAPWHKSRKELEIFVFTMMPEKELREALKDHISRIL